MKKNLQLVKLITVLGLFLFCSIMAVAQPNDWTKYEDNPVLSSPPWGEGAFYSAVLYEDNLYKIWYASEDGDSAAIAYAESVDGINWVINSKKEIESYEGGSWQTYKGPGTVLRVDDTLRMWYTGSSDGFTLDLAVGYAYYDESLLDWIITEDPILEGTNGSWDGQGVLAPVVYYNNGVYQMWFHGFENPSLYAPCGIGYATSSDGINWTKDLFPVMLPGPPNSFYSTWNITNCLIYREGQYQMWFSGWDGIQNPFNMRIGYATSPDGINWTVENNDSCVLDLGQSGSWDSREVRMAAVLSVNDTLRMWYSGIQTGIGGFSDSEIGYAWCLPEINPGTIEFGFIEKMYTRIFPNPLSTSATIEYDLKSPGPVNIIIYNHLGQIVESINQGDSSPGLHHYVWDASAMPAGIYFVQVKSGGEVTTRKMIKQ